MELTVHNTRRVLASNLRTFAAYASHLRHNPRQIAVSVIDRHATQCIANANFCFQIYAIDGDAYAKIRDIITDITVDIRRLRKVAKATNYICGQDAAISAARLDAAYQINRLWEVINFYNDEAQATSAA